MSIVFNAEDHSYKSINGSEGIDWTSVTTLVSSLKKPFDAKAVAARSGRMKLTEQYLLVHIIITKEKLTCVL